MPRRGLIRPCRECGCVRPTRHGYCTACSPVVCTDGSGLTEEDRQRARDILNRGDTRTITNGNGTVWQADCQEMRERALAGESASAIAASDDTPADGSGTVARHIRGDCTCQPDHPSLTYTGNSWTNTEDGDDGGEDA